MIMTHKITGSAWDAVRRWVRLASPAALSSMAPQVDRVDFGLWVDFGASRAPKNLPRARNPPADPPTRENGVRIGTVFEAGRSESVDADEGLDLSVLVDTVRDSRLHSKFDIGLTGARCLVCEG
jgi:hypothetical protein